MEVQMHGFYVRCWVWRSFTRFCGSDVDSLGSWSFSATPTSGWWASRLKCGLSKYVVYTSTAASIFMRIWAFGANSACSAYRLKLNIAFFSTRFKAKISSNLNGGRLQWGIVNYRERELLKHLSAFLIIFFCKNIN